MYTRAASSDLTKLASAFLDAELVVLDNDGTLYSLTSPIIRKFARTAGNVARQLMLESGIPDSEIPSEEEAAWDAYESWKELHSSMAVFNGKLGKFDRRTIHNRYLEACDVSVIPVNPLLPEMFETLTLLKKDYVMLTQGSRAWADKVVTHLDLKPFFPESRIYAFDEIGGEKKADSNHPFKHVGSCEACCPSKMMVIEDTLENLPIPDKLGATTVWISRGKKPKDPSLLQYIDFIVYDMRDVAAAVSLLKEPLQNGVVQSKWVAPSRQKGWMIPAKVWECSRD